MGKFFSMAPQLLGGGVLMVAVEMGATELQIFINIVLEVPFLIRCSKRSWT
jgi:hypothetical protein